jgi:hypothetical protein
VRRLEPVIIAPMVQFVIRTSQILHRDSEDSSFNPMRELCKKRLYYISMSTARVAIQE